MAPVQFNQIIGRGQWRRFFFRGGEEFVTTRRLDTLFRLRVFGGARNLLRSGVVVGSLLLGLAVSVTKVRETENEWGYLFWTNALVLI